VPRDPPQELFAGPAQAGVARHAGRIVAARGQVRDPRAPAIHGSHDRGAVTVVEIERVAEDERADDGGTW
jgi:hypothetical protein